MDLVDSLLNTPLGNEEMNTAAAPADNDNDDDNMTDEDSVQIRTMEVPRWLSTPEVTSELFYCSTLSLFLSCDNYHSTYRLQATRFTS
mmetsp:Transcript_17832/g.38541  ORF Transcript_17832/g.38541 Transcript_17832/m.38541 type:complete len:88 (+) Transcript_17832:133-396(+)